MLSDRVPYTHAGVVVKWTGYSNYFVVSSSQGVSLVRSSCSSNGPLQPPQLPRPGLPAQQAATAYGSPGALTSQNTNRIKVIGPRSYAKVAAWRLATPICMDVYPGTNVAGAPAPLPISGSPTLAGAPGAPPSVILALGSQRSTVHLVRFSLNEASLQTPNYSGTSHELLTRSASNIQQRPCTAVAWDPAVPGRIAVGLDKARTDFCVLVYDVHTMKTVSTNDDGTPFELSSTPPGKRISNHPLHRDYYGEGCASLAWLTGQATQTLACGTTPRWLRFIDLRSKGSIPAITAHPKAIAGVIASPLNDSLLSTWSDMPSEPLKVWDIRRMRGTSGLPTPLATIKLPKSSAKVITAAWSPMCSDVLCTVSTDAPQAVHTWDISRAMVRLSEAGPTDGMDSPTGRVSPPPPPSAHLAQGTTAVTQPIDVRFTDIAVSSLAWQSEAALPTPVTPKEMRAALASLCPVVVAGKSIEGVTPVQELSLSSFCPLSVACSGEVVLSKGQLSYEGALYDRDLADDEGDADATPKVNDIEEVMRRRAHNEYGMDVCYNQEMLASELAGYEWCGSAGQGSGGNKGNGSGITNMGATDTELSRLWRAWAWVERMETLCSMSAERQEGVLEGPLPTPRGPVHEAGGWSAIDLEDASVLDLLSLQPPSPAAGPTLKDLAAETHPTLGCAVFTSRGRRQVLQACGWSELELVSKDRQATKGKPDLILEETRAAQIRGLTQMMEEAEEASDYERSAALAVFHGDFKAAIGALMRGVEALRQMEDADVDKRHITDRQSMFQLVAMSIAGFSGGVSGGDTGGSLWCENCEMLLKSPQMQGPRSAAYLRAVVNFMIAIHESSKPGSAISVGRPMSQWGVPRNPKSKGKTKTPKGSKVSTSYSRILEDQDLALTDRVAFAAHYLSSDQLSSFLTNQTQLIEENGNLEGLLLVGLGARGEALLQSYLDRTADVQTVALLCSRTILGKQQDQRADQPPPKAIEWLECYRYLLNTWQLWHVRALVDVGRAELVNELWQRRKRLPGGSTGLASSAPSPNEDFLAAPYDVGVAVGTRVYVRCNFCNSDLPLSKQQKKVGMGGSWLSQQKPLLSCCPACRKPLPKCYICLLSLGALNPYLEMKRQQQKLNLLQRGRSKHLEHTTHTQRAPPFFTRHPLIPPSLSLRITKSFTSIP
ncbi:unnamed protein product, partial [Chrysoparadoxa australica]